MNFIAINTKGRTRYHNINSILSFEYGIAGKEVVLGAFGAINRGKPVIRIFLQSDPGTPVDIFGDEATSIFNTLAQASPLTAPSRKRPPRK